MKAKSPKNLSTAIYVRVSTEEQVQEGFSIRAQIEKLKSYALLKEWDIYDIYSDEGISGKNITERPAINRVIEDIQDGKVNNVLVFKVDRLTRSTKDLIALVDLFEEYNCAFNSLTESIDTDTPSGRMFLRIIGIFAEFERENISERARLGRERKVKEGYTLANYSMSYGYTKEKGEKVQAVQPDEAQIVREIYSTYVEKNQSMSSIARSLNERKISTKRNALAWDVATVRNILTNPTYIGKVRYSLLDEEKYFEVDGHHERIITDELFELAQKKIKKMPNISRTKRPKEDNYYCGVLVCGACGSKYTTHNQVSRVDENGQKIHKGSYRCSKKKKYFFPGDITCKSPDISHEKMERAFIDYIQRVNDFTSADDVAIEETAQNKEQELLDYIVNLEKQLDNLLDRKKQIMERYVGGEVEFEEYKSILGITNDKYNVLNDELDRKKAELPSVSATPNILPEDIILNLKENWDLLNNNERMMFLQRFVKTITITVEKERRNSSIVKIESVEFYSESPLTQSQTHNTRASLRGSLNRI